MRTLSGIILIIASLLCAYYGVIILFYKNKIDLDKILYSEKDFHIKVVPWGDDPDNWSIVFTRNNWLTKDEVKRCLVMPMFESVPPSLNPIFKKEEALELSKSLFSYEKCIEYNNLEKTKLDIYLEQWNKLPKKKDPDPIKRNEIIVL